MAGVNTDMPIGIAAQSVNVLDLYVGPGSVQVVV